APTPRPAAACAASPTGWARSTGACGSKAPPAAVPGCARRSRSAGDASAAQPVVGERRVALELAQPGGARRPAAHHAGAVEGETVAVVARLGLEPLQLGGGEGPACVRPLTHASG